MPFSLTPEVIPVESLLKPSVFKFTYEDLRNVCGKIRQSFVHNVFDIHTKIEAYVNKKEFKTPFSEQELSESLRDEKYNKLFRIKEDFFFRDAPELKDTFKSIDDPTKISDVETLLSTYWELCQFNEKLITKILDGKTKELTEIFIADLKGIVPHKDDYADLVGITSYEGSHEFEVEIDLTKQKNLSTSFSSRKYSINFIEKAMKVWQKILKSERQPTYNEFLMVYLAYNFLSNTSGSNNSLNKSMQSMGIPGFKACAQTHMAVTDPGNGHIYGTVSKRDWMKNGVTVHLEHLERGRDLTREQIESYRIPSIKKFRYTRFHVSDLAPTTIYIGRRLKDSGNFDNDLLKVSRTFVSCCDNIFSMGGAECKISMEFLTTYESLKHMRSISAELTKTPYQILAAAWNLNRELTHDLDTKILLENSYGFTLDFERQLSIKKFNDRFSIGKLAILFTKLGGFDKVTWDGASDAYPSKAIIPFQLSLVQGFTLVHLAHSVGLLTYFSAGFSFDEIKCGVLTGVDGIGIGGAQVLRFIDKKNGYHGCFQQENISAILEKRDQAEQTIYGKAVKLLCRLDTMYSEGSLTDIENERRRDLFDTLASRFSEMIIVKNESSGKNLSKFDDLCNEKNATTIRLENIMKSLDYICQYEDDENVLSKRNLYLNKLRRFLYHLRKPFMARRIPILLKNEDSHKISILKDNIEKIVKSNLESHAHYFYSTYPWKNIVDDYEKNILNEFVNKNIFENSLKNYLCNQPKSSINSSCNLFNASIYSDSSLGNILDSSRNSDKNND